MSYFDPYFSSKLGKMYSFDPPFFTLVAFRVDGRCWVSLSETQPSTPPLGHHVDSAVQAMNAYGLDNGWLLNGSKPNMANQYMK